MVESSLLASIKHYTKARVRRSLKAHQIDYRGLRHELTHARHVLICVVRDEGSRLPFFLEYYRNLGIEHFICIDNGSTDGTQDILSGLEDVSLLHASGSYKAARFGNDWVNQVINQHCQGKWVLYADADEFLVYPHCDSRKLDALTAYMDAVGGRSLRTMMVDMYSPRDILENFCETGRDPLEVCNLFDKSGYQSHFDKRNKTIWIKGGVRGRMYFQSDLWNGPALNKVPLIFVDGESLFLKSTHQAWPLSINLGSMPGAVGVTGALLHFKFLSTFAHKVADVVNLSQHTDEYALYSQAAKECFVSEETGVYKGWRDLADQGLIQGEGWTYWKSVSAETAAGQARTA